MATSSVNTLEDLVHCPVCFEEYNNPQSLICLHILCINCVRTLTKWGFVECPECRIKSLVSKIRKDFNKQNLVDFYHKQIDKASKITTVRKKSDSMLCENCEESKPVKWKCNECEGKFICEDCKNAHRLFASTKTHCLISVEQIADEMKLHLSSSVETMTQQKMALKSQYDKASRFLQVVNSAKGEACDEINKYRDQLKKEIDFHHDGLINDVSEHFQDKNISPANHKERIAEVIKDIDTKVALVEDISKTRHVKTLVDKTVIVVKDIDIDNIQSKIQHFEKVKCGGIPKVVIVKPMLLKPSMLTKLKLLDSLKQTNYMKLMDENITLIKDKEIFLEKDAYRLFKDNNQVWCVESDGACVYDEALNQVDEIKHSHLEYARSVKLDFNNNYIIACSGKKGLWQMDNDCEHVQSITKGNFTDMQLHNNWLFLLNQQKKCVSVFHYKYSCWQMLHEFPVVSPYVDPYDTLYVNDNFIYVSSRSNDKIYQYSHAGDVIQTYGNRSDTSPDQLKGPRLCGVDEHGNMLVADSFNNCLKVCSRSGEWHTLNVMRGISRPLDVLVDEDCQRLWVLTAKQIILMKPES